MSHSKVWFPQFDRIDGSNSFFLTNGESFDSFVDSAVRRVSAQHFSMFLTTHLSTYLETEGLAETSRSRALREAISALFPQTNSRYVLGLINELIQTRGISRAWRMVPRERVHAHPQVDDSSPRQKRELTRRGSMLLLPFNVEGATHP